jgi:hypothetical protein
MVTFRPRDRVCLWLVLTGEAGILILMIGLALGAVLHEQRLWLFGPLGALGILAFGLYWARRVGTVGSAPRSVSDAGF